MDGPAHADTFAATSLTTTVSVLTHLIYASSATSALEPNELSEILRVSRRNNERDGVTGMLLYTDGSFFQVLEGAPDVVDRVFARIDSDPRHRAVITIIHERIQRRAFGAWSMGFAELDIGELNEISGGNDFFSAAKCFDALGAGRAKKLLTAFREKRWRAAGNALAEPRR